MVNVPNRAGIALGSKDFGNLIQLPIQAGREQRYRALQCTCIRGPQGGLDSLDENRVYLKTPLSCSPGHKIGHNKKGPIP